MATAQSVIDRARQLVNDVASQFVSGLRWTDGELLQWLSDGQREVVKLQPEANAIKDSFPVVADKPRQRLDPEIAYRLIRVEANGVGLPPTPPVDGVLVMSAYDVLERRSTASGTYTPDGDWADTGVVTSASAGLAADLPMRALVCTEERGDDLSVRVTGTDVDEEVIQETITLLPGTMFRIGAVDFYGITSLQVLDSPGGSDGFFSVGARIRTAPSGTGFDQVTFAGAIDQNLQLTVSATERTLSGPLTPFTPTGVVGQQFRVNFAALGFTNVSLFITRIANSAARTVNLVGTPASESVVLSGSSVQSVGTFTALNAVIVTAGTSVAPFVTIGASYRAPVS